MDRLKIGIVGCGAIAQIQYLPLLREMVDEFAIGALCDLSPTLLRVLGDRFDVPADHRFTDYRDLARSDVDAVIVCSTGSHAPPAIAAAQAGKHLLVEKPMCTTPAEGCAMVEAAERAGVTLLIGYMKQHDPAYRYARERVAQMTDLRFVQVNHLHPDNRVHLARFNLLRGDDLPATARAELEREYTQTVATLLGYQSSAEVPEPVRKAHFWVHNSMIHDLGNLHGLFGPPERVVSTELWADGNSITTIFAYPSGVRAVCSWIDVPDLPVFTETVEVYGARERVIVAFPTGFSLGQPSTVTIHDSDTAGHPRRTELSWHENPFALELRHLKHCIRTGERPLTDGTAAVRDIELVRDMFTVGLGR